MTDPRILIVYYSHSSQTRKLLQAFAAGLAENKTDIHWQRLKPLQKLQFPFGSIPSTLAMMVTTFFRRRYELEPLGLDIFKGRDIVILGGPTWSYNPSGPVLSFLDKYGSHLSGKKVIPVISCRGYWRTHYFQLRSMLSARKAEVLKPVVFLHTGVEPWRTVGVFLKLAGRAPDLENSWIGRYYRKFGHTRAQLDLAEELGAQYAAAIKKQNLSSLPAMVIRDVESMKRK